MFVLFRIELPGFCRKVSTQRFQDLLRLQDLLFSIVVMLVQLFKIGLFNREMLRFLFFVLLQLCNLLFAVRPVLF